MSITRTAHLSYTVPILKYDKRLRSIRRVKTKNELLTFSTPQLLAALASCLSGCTKFLTNKTRCAWKSTERTINSYRRIWLIDKIFCDFKSWCVIVLTCISSKSVSFANPSVGKWMHIRWGSWNIYFIYICC